MKPERQYLYDTMKQDMQSHIDINLTGGAEKILRYSLWGCLRGQLWSNIIFILQEGLNHEA